ncbi:protein AGENET DOMAIN (AGD)-CONTAINING P1-like [Punica granatum]|uniref:Protein AGENET DOMAIN (AGD)-CONTAINING P1-like n=1 Tax=Punica granatum TaxID=22663 RepID=A0A6P8ECI6_PUNGR|nr:protein AGENET DOMAIN (AGD)-CONTAINING P1-like [Punica granatum]
MPPAAAFFPGDTVEIASNDDGFHGSWFTGIVVRLLSAPSSSGRRKAAGKATLRYLIQFDTLFEDEAGTKRQTEVVDEYQMRPVPPSEPRRAFKLGEEVDAYYNDGWWEGSITEELGSGKFEVYFRASKESIQFKSERLRLHREWTNNAWFPPFDEEKNAFGRRIPPWR